MYPYRPVLQKQYDHYSLISPMYSSVIPSFHPPSEVTNVLIVLWGGAGGVPQSATCGISVPQPGAETVPVQQKHSVLPENFVLIIFLPFFNGFIMYLCILKLFIY